MPVSIRITRHATEVADVVITDLPADATNEEIEERIYGTDLLTECAWEDTTDSIDWVRNNTGSEVDEPTPSE